MTLRPGVLARGAAAAAGGGRLTERQRGKRHRPPEARTGVGAQRRPPPMRAGGSLQPPARSNLEKRPQPPGGIARTGTALSRVRLSRYRCVESRAPRGSPVGVTRSGPTVRGDSDTAPVTPLNGPAPGTSRAVGSVPPTVRKPAAGGCRFCAFPPGVSANSSQHSRAPFRDATRPWPRPPSQSAGTSIRNRTCT